MGTRLEVDPIPGPLILEELPAGPLTPDDELLISIISIYKARNGVMARVQSAAMSVIRKIEKKESIIGNRNDYVRINRSEKAVRRDLAKRLNIHPKRLDALLEELPAGPLTPDEQLLISIISIYKARNGIMARVQSAAVRAISDSEAKGSILKSHDEYMEKNREEKAVRRKLAERLNIQPKRLDSLIDFVYKYETRS